jgi:transcriptional regulator with XRE-family HTH domain
MHFFVHAKLSTTTTLRLVASVGVLVGCESWARAVQRNEIMKIGETAEPRHHHEGLLLDRETFGRRLRDTRRGLGWTLQHLSELSGVSVPTISRAERSQLALGYENFAALGHALKMDMNAMFAADGVKTAALRSPVVTRFGQGVAYCGRSFTYEFLGTGATGKLMNPVVGTVHARRIEGPEDFARHAGEEFAYVLSGVLEVHFDTGQVVRLARGVQSTMTATSAMRTSASAGGLLVSSALHQPKVS